MSVIARRFHDRAGNQLFQYVTARAYSEMYGCELQTDPWWGQRVFGLTEKPIAHELPKRADMDLEKWNGDKNIEITGWCLHQKCILYTRKQAKGWLRFTDEMTHALQHVQRYEVAYHLRWGDFQTMADFIAISHQSYEKAFQEHLPDFHHAPQMICAWDSLRSAKLENLGLGWLPDFAAMMRAKVLFRGNSTFSFWSHVLGDNEKIFSPRLNGIAPAAHIFQNVPFVAGNWPAISCVHPNCSDLHLPEI